MTQEELELAYYGKRPKYLDKGFECLEDGDIEILVLFEMWKDGADWETVLEMKDDGMYRDRSLAIQTLTEQFDYVD